MGLYGAQNKGSIYPTGKRDLNECTWYGDKYDGAQPTPFRLEDLVDLKKGDSAYSHTGCTAYGLADEARATDRGFSWPNNSEFEFAGSGDRCDMWSSSHGCGRPSGGIVGKRPGVKRVSYNAGKKECCLSGKDIINGNTCDPKYRDGTGSDCADIMKDHCRKGSNIFTQDGCRLWGKDAKGTARQYKKYYCNHSNIMTDDNCFNWAKKETDVAMDAIIEHCKDNPLSKRCQEIMTYTNRGNIDKIMAPYCKHNFDKKECQNWANGASSNYRKTKLDTLVREWCEQNPDSNFCKCQNVEATEDQIKKGYSNPRCFSIQCSDPTTYIPSRFEDNCPTVISCNQAIEIQNNQAMDINIDDLSQSCEISSGGKVISDTSQTQNTQPSSGNNTVKDPTQEADAYGDTDISGDGNFMLIIIILIIIAVSAISITLVGGLGYYYYTK